ncbi:MAG: hypothetical protein JXB13_21650 [Phycisphaerae bacterium]|nr:hypothetical protein [Phycisphaerae bacterium]
MPTQPTTRDRRSRAAMLNGVAVLLAGVWAGALIAKRGMIVWGMLVSTPLPMVLRAAAIIGVGLIALGEVLLLVDRDHRLPAALAMIVGGVALLPIGVLSIRAAVLLLRPDRPATSAKRSEEGARCLRCGYSLQGLTVPRCPECGTLRGFKQSFEELGIRKEELKDKPPRPDP